MSNQNVNFNHIVEKTSAAKSLATQKVREIQDVTSKLKILSLNAMIEAKRAGDFGRGFGVVADEVKSISSQVQILSDTLSSQLGAHIHDLEVLTKLMAEQSQGNRMVDIALNAVELIDRNLYERTCDVRWWATDSAIVNAAANDTQENCDYASRRLGVILDAYTVYLDLWLCDLNGNIIASGRPERYRAIGSNVSGRNWFQNAKYLQSGADFCADDIAIEPILNGKQVATYATGVRENGEENGRLLGVLGIQFDWQPQAASIVKGIRTDDPNKTEVLLIDRNGTIIASSNDEGILSQRVELTNPHQGSGYYFDARGSLIAFHQTPGYETYQGMGWYGVIRTKP